MRQNQSPENKEKIELLSIAYELMSVYVHVAVSRWEDTFVLWEKKRRKSKREWEKTLGIKKKERRNTRTRY